MYWTHVMPDTIKDLGMKIPLRQLIVKSDLEMYLAGELVLLAEKRKQQQTSQAEGSTHVWTSFWKFL